MPKTKLSLDEVEHLLKVAATGLLTQQQIAEDWGVSKSYVSRLVTGQYRRKGFRQGSVHNPLPE